MTIKDKAETKIWGIHNKSGDDDELFLSESVIALSFEKLRILPQKWKTREDFFKGLLAVYPDLSKHSAANLSGQLYRFVIEAVEGDYVIFPSRSDRKVNIGVIGSSYYEDELSERYRHRRKVRWLKSVPRTSFSQGALYEIGSAMSFFSVKNYADEFLSALKINHKPDSKEEIGANPLSIVLESTKDFVLKSLSRNLKGYDFQDFVADLLRAMGYRAILSPRGGDRGVDILAYKDEFPPRIVVQVKSQDEDIPETFVHSLRGTMKEGDYGVFITLSGYTRNARKYLDETPIIHGIDGSALVELILKYYDSISEKYKNLIPLKKIYVPDQSE